MSRNDMIIELSNAGILLDTVETKGEKNLNNLLLAIQKLRAVRNALKEEEENAGN